MNEKNIKPKVLYVISLLPCPPEIGVHHRVLNIGRQLKKYAEVSIVCVGPSVEKRRLESTQRELGPVRIMGSSPIEPPGIAGSVIRKFKFHWPWYHADKISPQDRREFQTLCRTHDLIWFHTLRAADLIGQYRIENALVDFDDLNQTKYQLMRQKETSWRGKIGTAILTYKWCRWEQKALDRFSWFVVCSEKDLSIVGNPERTVVVPNGYLLPEKEPVWQDRQEKRLGFLGFLGYTPNRRGLKWFSEKVWPKILQRIPEAKFRVMGHFPESHQFGDVERMDRLGFVKDTAEEMSTWNAMIVPLHYGGGTRLKILEAFSKKCPVISTQVGAYGLDVSHEKNILLADQADAFANQCVRALEDSTLGQILANGGWELFTEKYTWEKIGQRIEKFLKSITEKSRKRNSQDFSLFTF